MDSRILYLNTLAEPVIRFGIVFMYIIVTMDKECAKTSFTFSIRRLVACLVVHRLHISLPVITHIATVHHFFIRPSACSRTTAISLEEAIVTLRNKAGHAGTGLVDIEHFITDTFL